MFILKTMQMQERYIDNISTVSSDIKFMCIRLQNWDKGEFNDESFHSFAPNTHKLLKY